MLKKLRGKRVIFKEGQVDVNERPETRRGGGNTVYLLETDEEQDQNSFMCFRQPSGDLLSRNFHYRVEERTVRVFAPGTSAAVL